MLSPDPKEGHPEETKEEEVEDASSVVKKDTSQGNALMLRIKETKDPRGKTSKAETTTDIKEQTQTRNPLGEGPEEVLQLHLLEERFRRDRLVGARVLAITGSEEGRWREVEALWGEDLVEDLPRVQVQEGADD